MTKAENRFQEEKHKVKIRRFLKDVLHYYDKVSDDKFVGIETSVHGKRCSCPMCCNMRRSPYASTWEKLTMQEKKALLDFKENEDDENS